MREVRGYHMSRRDLLAALGATLATGCRSRPFGTDKSSEPRIASLAAGRSPELRWGVQSGDVTSTSGVVWSRADRPSRLVVEWSPHPRMFGAQRILGPVATEATDLTARLAITRLPPGTRIHYRA